MPDSFKTRRELVERALRALGVTGAGQAPAPEDVQRVDEEVEGVLGALEAREIIEGVDPEEIPIEFVAPLSLVLANEVAAEFGVVGPDGADLAARANRAEQDMRIMQRSRPGFGHATPEYF